MSYLSIERLNKSYGAFRAVSDVSIRLRKGEVCSLLGPSGCGKTTTLRSIAGLESPDSGRIVLDGRVLADPGAGVFVPPESRNLGMVFQSYALWPHKSVRENIALGLKIKGMSGSAVDDKVAQVLALVGLPGAEGRFPSSLSGGQQQRIALARAIALEPKCLLFDEPLSNLDLILREKMRFEIRELLTKVGITAVYVTHDQSEAMALSDHIVVMNHGCIQQEGAPAEIYANPRNRFTAEFLGRTNILPLDRAASRVGDGVLVAASGLAMRSAHAGRLAELAGDALIAFRPEMARVVDEPVGENVFTARAREISFLGAQTQVAADLEGVSINIVIPGPSPLRRDDPVHVRVDPEHVLVIEDETA